MWAFASQYKVLHQDFYVMFMFSFIFCLCSFKKKKQTKKKKQRERKKKYGIGVGEEEPVKKCYGQGTFTGAILYRDRSCLVFKTILLKIN